MSKQSSKTINKSAKQTFTTPSSNKVTQVKLYEQRKNKSFDDVITEIDQSRSITGSSKTINQGNINSNSLLLAQSNNDDFNVDMEANRSSHYGTICNDNSDSNNRSYINWIANLNPFQFWFMVAGLIGLIIGSLILYFTGNIEQLTFIWGKIFCLLGIARCSSSATKNLLTNV